MSTLDLSAIRHQIDELDAQLQTLMNRRATLALDVARAKRALEPDPDFYRPEREAEVLSKAIARNQAGPLSNDTVSYLFREIMSACLALQKPLQVAYLGPQGTYSEAAVLKQFGHAVKGVPVQTIEEVFREVAAGNVHYGVVPVENSTEGGVNQSLDMFLRSELRICGEVDLPIHHCLMSRSSDMAALTVIYSHQQSLAQCRLWLDTHFPKLERITVSSNAEAARRAAEEPSAGAVAGQTAAERYGLTVLASQIEDQVDNITRFAVLGRHPVPPTGYDKTSLLVSASNRPGALHHLLTPFSDQGLSLTRIESRPSRQGMWEYVFFIDVEGHLEDPPLKQALEALRHHSALLKHLGSYPRASR